MNIIILGAPGAGKGTQGEFLSRELKIPRLSVGALLRRVWEKGDADGQEIGRYILKGLNVPAELLFKILENWFRVHQNGFIIDNLPRNIDQLEEFKEFIKREDIKIDKVFHLLVSEKESVKRLSFRQRERLKESLGRPDEDLAVIQTRIHEGYEKEIKPIIDYFKAAGVLVEINGEQSIEKVHQDILNSLK